MEVFLSRLPPQLNDRTLEKELRPYMNALGVIDWSCSCHSNKKLGWVTFLRREDGVAFLKRHEKQPLSSQPTNSQRAPRLDSFASTRLFANNKGPRCKANLFLMNVPVFAEESNKPPDPFHLKSLAHRLPEKSKQRHEQNTPAANNAVVFAVRWLECGHNSFQNDTQVLTFVQQCRIMSAGSAKFGKKLLILKYDGGIKLEIPYLSIVEMIHNSSPCTFTLVLGEPPRFYHPPNYLDQLMGRLGMSGQSSPPKHLVRGTSIANDPNHAKFAGKCLVYHFHVIDPDFDHKMITLETRGLFTIAHFNIAYNEHPHLSKLDYTTAWKAFNDHLAEAEGARIMPFRILFLMQSLAWNNYLHPRVADDLLTKMQVSFHEARVANQPDPISEQAIKNLRDGPRDGLPFPVSRTDPHLLDSQEILEYLFEVEERIRVEADYRNSLFGQEFSSHHTWILKAVVTPTRITLHGPEMEPLNRILRKYPDHTDYFMRVQFCDEDGTDLSFNPRISFDEIFDRYRDVLNNGISVAGRVYGFLGFSHSSLRSHSAWFMAPVVYAGALHMYQHIIKSLGDFDDIQIPAKCAARIGQAFSETPSFISLDESQIRQRCIPDIKKQHHGIERVFSDGVGTISQEALEMIWLRLPRGSSVPTCLQIRWGGVKGMLSLDSRLPGRLMCIRQDSMEKFPSKDKANLEICDAASKPLRLVLNRQMIKIMEDLGVADSFFLGLQKMELDRLRAVTADAYNTGTFLHMQGIGSSFFLPTFIKGLEKCGIDYRRDEFLRLVVEAVVLRELRLLKHKARIPVPRGATLFGIMDETGFLREGEVYICYDTYRRPGKAAIDDSLRDGYVLVTRSPALHPGDIQVAKMRTPPVGHPLRNLRNCIAFSQFGNRDLPSQLSGGDLDGDLYNVIWDRASVPKRVFSPADYPRGAPASLGRKVTREDMANWFVDFMKSDVLGMIATRHLILSDQDPNGTVGGDCLKLADLHSTAVDFSKTGVSVDPKDIPKAPKFRPDFLAPAPPAHLYDRHQIDFIGHEDTEADEDDMTGPNHQYYPSERILGTLYRNVDEKQIWDDDIRRVVSQSGPSVWDQFVGLVKRKIEDYTQGTVSWETKRSEAKRLRDVYEELMRAAMSQYSDNFSKPLKEVEVVCGSIFNKSGSQTRRQKDNSKKLKTEFDRLSEWLVAQMRRKPRQSDQGSYGTAVYSGTTTTGTQTPEQSNTLLRMLAPNKEALEMSYACLMVGLRQNRDVEYEHRAQMQSFKVIAASVLLRELTELVNRVRGGRMVAPTNGDGGPGGGFVGVSSGPAAAYAYNGYDVDVGQYPNYGYSEYL